MYAEFSANDRILIHTIYLVSPPPSSFKVQINSKIYTGATEVLFDCNDGCCPSSTLLPFDDESTSVVSVVREVLVACKLKV